MSPWSRWVLIECYRLSGRWPESVMWVNQKTGARMFPNGVPEAMQREAETARASFDEDRHAAEGLRDVYGGTT